MWHNFFSEYRIWHFWEALTIVWVLGLLLFFKKNATFWWHFAPMLYFKIIDRANNIVNKGQVWPIITDESAVHTLNKGLFPKKSRDDHVDKKICHQPPRWHVLSFSGGIFLSECFLSPKDFNAAITTVWHQSMIRRCNDPSLFFLFCIPWIQ